MSGRWVNVAEADDRDRAAAARFGYFLRLVRQPAPPRHGPRYDFEAPWLRPLQRAWLVRYAAGAPLERGLR